jgi:hypothetical protein
MMFTDITKMTRHLPMTGDEKFIGEIQTNIRNWKPERTFTDDSTGDFWLGNYQTFTDD